MFTFIPVEALGDSLADFVWGRGTLDVDLGLENIMTSISLVGTDIEQVGCRTNVSINQQAKS